MAELHSRLFNLAQVVEACEQQGTPYLEFLRVPALSCGIYQLAAGAEDSQTSHVEDEVYLVLKGKAKIIQDGKEDSIERGSILYIPADAQHHFVEIEEDLSLLVFFGSGGPSGADL